MTCGSDGGTGRLSRPEVLTPDRVSSATWLDRSAKAKMTSLKTLATSPAEVGDGSREDLMKRYLLAAYVLPSVAFAADATDPTAILCFGYDTAFYVVAVLFVLGMFHLSTTAVVGFGTAAGRALPALALVTASGVFRFLTTRLHPEVVCGTSGQLHGNVVFALMVASVPLLFMMIVLRVVRRGPQRRTQHGARGERRG